MPLELSENPVINHKNTAVHREVIVHLSKDYIFFAGMRGLTVVFFMISYASYIRRNLDNLNTSSDLSILFAIASTMRELQSPISNSVKDAYDSKNIDKLQDLHLVGMMTAVNPTLVTWFLGQIYTATLPLNSPSSDQLLFLPSMTLPVTGLTMMLSVEYIYGSIRNPKPVMCFFLASGPVVLLTSYAFAYLSPDAISFVLAQGSQSLFFVASTIAFFQWKYPNEHFIKNLFRMSQWKDAYISASKDINRLGIQPALIAFTEVLSGILINRSLAPESLAAYQPMSTIIFGLFNIISMTMLQRNSLLARNQSNTYSQSPDELRARIRSTLINASWLSLVLPLALEGVNLATGNVLIDLLYNTNKANSSVVEEAKFNVPFVMLASALRLLSAAPAGIIFSVRNSPIAYHQRLNRYATLIRSVTPLLLFAIGFMLDYAFDLRSTSYWAGGIIAYALSNILLSIFAWHFIEYEYQQGLLSLDALDMPVPSQKKSAYCFGFFDKKTNTSPPEALPMMVLVGEEDDGVVNESPKPGK